MSRHTHLLIATAVALGIAGIMVGCGGQKNPPAATTTGQGMVTVTIAWPPRSEVSEVTPALIPERTESIRVEFFRGDELVEEGLIQRPEASKTFGPLPALTLRVRATAHPDAKGRDTAQAQGETTVKIEHNGTVSVQLTLASTIATMEIMPNPALVELGDTVQLTAAVKDAAGDIVLVRPDNPFTWSVESAQGCVKVSDNGLVTTLAKGDATVKATEAETGVSGTAMVTVTFSYVPPPRAGAQSPSYATVRCSMEPGSTTSM